MIFISLKRFALSLAALSLCMGLVACGNGGGGDLSTPSRTPELQLLAGSTGSFWGNRGSIDATGTTAQFNLPRGVTVDVAGNLYVTDFDNHTIRKITPAAEVTTIAGAAGFPGSIDGVGANARFAFPAYITGDTAGNLYVTDGSTVRKLTPDGVVTTLAGRPGVIGSADGIGAAASFDYPSGITTDSAGNLYVAEMNNNTIRKITPAGVVTTLAGAAKSAGSADGVGATARFFYPDGITSDAAGNLYVSDMGNSTIRKIMPSGVVTTLAGMPRVIGSADGVGAAARFSWPTGITADALGNLSVVDGANHTIRKISPAGVVTTLAGMPGISGSDDGAGPAARFYYPSGITMDVAGNLYVADESNQAIRKITPEGAVTTFAGQLPPYGSADGKGSAARFNGPQGVAVDAAGNVYVADTSSQTIRKITSVGTVTTLAGTPGVYGSTDGIGATARFNYPVGITLDATGNIYVVEAGNNGVRKITQGGVVTTVAGTAGTLIPTGIAADPSGNLYITDYSTVRKVPKDGVVAVLAGVIGAFGYADGTGASARFNHPAGITLDSAGNLYVTDYLYSGGDWGLPDWYISSTIRKITPTGAVTTVAGVAGAGGYQDGLGGAAQFKSPQGIAADSSGSLYVADSANHTIRKITPAGMVTTIAGVAGQSDILLGSLPGHLQYPFGLALIDDHTLVLTTGNSVLKLILP